MKKLACLSAVLLTTLALAAPAMAYETYHGGFRIDGKTLTLGDGAGSGRVFTNDPGHCGPKATLGSQHIRAMLSRDAKPVTWYITHECTYHTRICIVRPGTDACNTYRDHGWEAF